MVCSHLETDNHGDNIKSKSQQVDTFVSSRGKSLVERVVKEQVC